MDRLADDQLACVNKMKGSSLNGFQKAVKKGKKRGGGTTGKNGNGKGESDFRGVFPGKDRETILGKFCNFFGKNRETVWVFASGDCKRIGKNRETILGQNFSGKIGKRYGFLKVVTVNRSGKIGKRFWGENFSGKIGKQNRPKN